MPDISRSNLPIPHREHVGLITFDAKDPDTKFPAITSPAAPEGAPNVVIILIDDAGFGSSSAFGGPCYTPNAERLAEHGVRFNRFHTTALCSPSRQALLTGRNHHAVGMGGITEIATSAPGYNSVRPDSAAPLAQTLNLNGYATAQFGKCHEVPVWETSPAGPYQQWPTGSGFDYFYGFVGAETNQWYPALYEGTTPIEAPKTPEEGYHLTEDLTDHAVNWMHQQKSLMPDKPFFIYFAPGATHAPHHVATEWSDKYKGKFDKGWDAQREETLAKQITLGIVPEGTALTERPEAIGAWNDVSDGLKPVLARQMELYAGFMEHTDHEIGRVLDSLDDLGILDNTLVYLIIGDNGASAEGTPQGTFNEMISLNGMAALETEEFMAARIDEFGGTDSYNHYAVGWAHAMNTPFQWTKQVASHFGGTRVGAITHWPKGFTSQGEIRPQFHHLIDVASTILEVAGIPEPTFVNGIQQMPYHGVSMAYAFDDGAADDQRKTQYFEVACNRGIYHNGWTAVTRHSNPWLFGETLPALDDDVWELYDTTTDWSQAHDLSAEHPDKLKDLQRLWLIEAVKYNVLPLDDRRIERFNSDIAGRPQLVKGESQLIYGSMSRLSENSVLNIKNKSHSVTAEIVVPESGANGVIVSQGGAFAGWSLYLHEGKPKYCHNLAGLMRFYAASDDVVSPGTHQVRMEFAYDGGGLAKGGLATLFIDGAEVGNGRIGATIPMIYSGDETLDIGLDTGTPVSEDYEAEVRFTGAVNWVELQAGVDGQDHLISAEDRMRVATALQ
ncbi:arylsulfatase [Subtercola endophyticus]|uniref:arylsulfatase n=1 Tax=Subtercola endophyticus TaxID=2895559 RepID=UPI001E389DA0|nr:arylsulfatase [Subtercola endophyticus]UFS59560.1 arylsulfatase [Subtercola endophyticus]